MPAAPEPLAASPRARRPGPALAAALLLAIACGTGAPGRQPPAADPAARLHGHNDYLQPRPLQTALELGLGSVEADVFLDGGELRVGHERWQLRPGRTLQRLYLEPLAAAVRSGALRPDRAAPPFVLLVDVKADPDAVWPVLDAALREHRAMLTRFLGERVERGAVTVLLSGARPRRQLATATERYCALDGRLADLDAAPPPPPSLVPWISDAWRHAVDWDGKDEPLPAELARLRALVARAHAQGRELRFWGAPDRAEVWRLLLELGVDRIGTDRPRAAAASLREAVAR